MTHITTHRVMHQRQEPLVAGVQRAVRGVAVWTMALARVCVALAILDDRVTGPRSLCCAVRMVLVPRVPLASDAEGDSRRARTSV